MNFKEYNLTLSQQTYERLEDAIVRVMDEKTANPQSIIYVYPASLGLYYKWEENFWWVCSNMAYSNPPSTRNSKRLFRPSERHGRTD